MKKTIINVTLPLLLYYTLLYTGYDDPLFKTFVLTLLAKIRASQLYPNDY